MLNSLTSPMSTTLVMIISTCLLFISLTSYRRYYQFEECHYVAVPNGIPWRWKRILQALARSCPRHGELASFYSCVSEVAAVNRIGHPLDQRYSRKRQVSGRC